MRAARAHLLTPLSAPPAIVRVVDEAWLSPGVKLQPGPKEVRDMMNTGGKILSVIQP